MKSRKYNQINEEMITKIISVAYGDASIKDRAIVFFASRQNDEVSLLLDDYRKTARSVHSIQPEECPEELLNITTQSLGMKNNREKSFWLDLYTAFFARPLVSAAATVIVLAVIMMSLLFYKPDYQNGYSKEEIELANKQVKYALSMVKNALTKSNKILTEDILKNKVAKPIGEGINYVNTLLKEEK